jgi:hypothetical protein
MLLILFVSIVFTALCLKTGALSSTTSCENADLRQAEVGYQKFGETDYEFHWNKTYPNAGRAVVAVDSENFIYIAIGNLTGTTLYKYDMEGTVIWSRLWNYKSGSNDRPRHIAVDTQNNVIVAGFTQYLSGFGDIYIVKYNPDGVPLWNVTWASVGYEFFNDMAIDSGNNIWIVGEFEEGEFAGNYDAFLARFDPLGNLLLNKTWGIPSFDETAKCCAVDGSYNCYVGASGFKIMVFNPSGTSLWNTSWGDSSELPQGIEFDGEGNFYVVGPSFDPPSGLSPVDIFIVKFNSTGGKIWQRFWGTYDYTEQYVDLVIGPNLTYVVGTHQGAPDNQIVVIAYDSDGNQPWHLAIDLDGGEQSQNIALDANGNIYVAGSSNTPSYAFLFLLVLPSTNGGGDGIPSFGLFLCVLLVISITSVIARKKYSKIPF